MTRSKSKGKPRKESEFSREVRAEVRRSHRTLLITEAASVINTMVRWGFPCAAIVLGSYFLSGQQTGVKIEGIFNAFANQWLYLTIAGLCGGGWAIERRTLRRRIKEMSDEKKQLEAVIDPARTSSGMNANGEPVRA
jgi:hypothetical protein